MPQAPRFEEVTETTGIPVTPEGARMMYTRYARASALGRGKKVLEIACGGGNGLGMIGAEAALLVGGDYSAALLGNAGRHYRNRFPLVRFSAEDLPFASGSFDTVLFFEASYYVPDMTRAFREAARVLAPGGTMMFVNANPERPDFISSPHSVRYHTADEFRTALEALGLRVVTQGAFPTISAEPSLSRKLIDPLLKVARVVLESMGLVPKTLQGRARLKKLIFRNLRLLPEEIPVGFADVEPLAEVPAGVVRGYKVLYVTGSRDG